MVFQVPNKIINFVFKFDVWSNNWNRCSFSVVCFFLRRVKDYASLFALKNCAYIGWNIEEDVRTLPPNVCFHPTYVCQCYLCACVCCVSRVYNTYAMRPSSNEQKICLPSNRIEYVLLLLLFISTQIRFPFIFIPICWMLSVVPSPKLPTFYLRSDGWQKRLNVLACTASTIIYRWITEASPDSFDYVAMALL